jgi:GDP-L-fucose synthase
MVGGRMMIENQPLIIAQDLSIDSEMWQWSKTNVLSRVCYFSSSAAYPLKYQGYAGHRNLEESDISWESEEIGFPDLSYGWAKLTGEYLAKLALEKYGLRSTIYRPFSGYGSDQDLTYPFPAIIKRAIDFQYGKGQEFFVWGSGRQSRDFIHIDDCVSRIIRTWDLVSPGTALNLSTGIGTTFMELAQLALVACGKEDVKIVNMSEKPEGVFYRVGDTRLQKTIDPTGIVRDINYGVKQAIQELKQDE